jgi:serine/threonine-protein kinase
MTEVDWLNRQLDEEFSRRESVSIEEAKSLLWRLQSPLVPGFDRLRLIAHGGSGMVLSGISPKDNQLKAVKIGLKTYRTHFEWEFQIQFRFISPRIIRVEEMGTTTHGEPYIIMEHIEGMNLLDYLEWQGDEEAPFDFDQTLQIATEACEALAVCHRAGIVHRDVKLENLILSNGKGVKLGDFSLSIEECQARKQVLNRSDGTEGYIAPELADGSSLPSMKSDVFAMGRLLYQLFTGEIVSPEPFETLPHPKRHRTGASIPNRLIQIIGRALKRDPRQRYASGEPLWEDLKRLIEVRREGF